VVCGVGVVVVVVVVDVVVVVVVVVRGGGVVVVVVCIGVAPPLVSLYLRRNFGTILTDYNFQKPTSPLRVFTMSATSTSMGTGNVITINVKGANRKGITMQVKSNDNIDTVQAEVLQKMQIPPERQCIIVADIGWWDDFPLHDLGNSVLCSDVKDKASDVGAGRDSFKHEAYVSGSVEEPVSKKARMQRECISVWHIYVNLPTGETITLAVNPHSTLKCVMSMINGREGTPLHNQRLVFAGEELNMHTPLLTHYNIQAGSVLRLECGTQIVVQNEAGKRIILKVRDRDCIEDVKAMIMDKMSIQIHRQILVYNGITLQDGTLLRRLKLSTVPTLMLVCKPQLEEVRGHTEEFGTQDCMYECTCCRS
jgi:hypothetical protein